jgi:hypothetical protein
MMTKPHYLCEWSPGGMGNLFKGLQRVSVGGFAARSRRVCANNEISSTGQLGTVLVTGTV